MVQKDFNVFFAKLFGFTPGYYNEIWFNFDEPIDLIQRLRDGDVRTYSQRCDRDGVLEASDSQMIEYLDSQVRRMYELVGENPSDLCEKIVEISDELADYRKMHIEDREAEILNSQRGREIIAWFRGED
jgi:hypothetical protein